MEIDAIAAIARLGLDEEEKKIFSFQLTAILGYVDRLKQVNVESMEEETHAFEVSNVWRQDLPQESFEREDFLRIAPSVEDGQVVVPKVIEFTSQGK